ncbi:dihydroxyacetone kinase subunit DhaK [Bradyrhizobium sp. U87765 SZCCT0131]|uniref:dihydroxyacetone kinase subunit DhaK n=1 Tax=unclassified Bradyrhizobium TaxID=2631580 RepID=UPI001BACF203|nr:MULTISPECIES: dihydroxyacetone kinase subunit DhaK [unclassified Bradyrhizobium]MBR1218778.1 dihydroxyacetone kinase subunit DhaK [Bradyrhizobium sp. U87765 SZCCT0131]MBR1265463.1 dihydroxyacetone kinase subunit DhaK [Bradyrhizobium sp. U87765 SZCCT0134]MBR1304277.1 dihydroxyacetone kinase subunit DhaK [Bradyrhizobium sp. U87765 SZCCT0110]MBR1319882.1 dihydroxyacetone kinase subunit DhaK [Bradyrhizobium sp. U87765 SZCCT0109]MBR1348208.1 dihydroxyacetone kinase subunit DhaK [Bradyrhizobium s
MAQFINAREDIVQEALDGLVAASGGQLVRLDGYPFIRVIARSDWNHSRVAVISGGGSGHEPAHAGFVGPGMLTAAVCGDVFASPSVDAVLSGILAVTGAAGCVLIVKNYTGDRLNFGLAAERARALGRKVTMVIVQDDIAIPDIGRPRGIAGTLFVHKLAGAVSESGGDLDAVTAAARRAASRVMSIGMSLDTCTVPGSPREDRIQSGEIELGLGIHGEAGAAKFPYLGARQAMADAVARFLPRMSGNSYAALLNNLGSTTALEMSILAEELRRSAVGPAVSHIVGPAAMMTALDMHGFSLTLYSLNTEDEKLLTAETPLRTWPGLRTFVAPRIVPLPDGLARLRPTPSAEPATEEFLIRCCKALIAAEADLNALDARAGDGDTGTTLAGAASALIQNIGQLPLSDHTQLYRALGQELSQTMGGSSGVLLAIFFAAAGDAVSNGHSLMSALKVGLARMQEVGGAQPGDRTMIDALLPALDALPQGATYAARAARKGANLTATMSRAGAGRSAYIGAEQLQGHADPGAEAVARLFESLC